MKVKCDYCDNFHDENEAQCPFCGAANEHIKRTAIGVPKTIEELRQWYMEHNLPPEEVTRFFIGQDYKKPKAFGIYRKGEKVIVYKNKDDGSRAIRYEGEDEAYAVNELYMKLKEQISWQKNNNRNGSRNRNGGSSHKKRGGFLRENFTAVRIIIIAIIVIGILAAHTPHTGYYRYDDDVYYYHNDWYVYDGGYWDITTAPSELSDNYKDYYEGSSSYSELGVENIENTSWADNWANDSDWDDDSDWDSSDSWDSDGGTDWGSDW